MIKRACLLGSLLFSVQTWADSMVTREMGVMSRREHALEDAFAAGDLSALDNLLSPQFEVRTALHPGKPKAKDIWLNQLNVSVFPGKMSEWSVFSDGVGAWVSYLWTPKGGGQTLWVLDRWDGVDDNAHLMTRFYAESREVKLGH